MGAGLRLAGAAAGDHGEVAESAGARIGEVEAEREVEFHAGFEEGELGREDAGNGEALVAEADGLSGDGGVAGEAALPERVGQQGDGGGTGAVFLGAEGAADERADAKQGEHPGGDAFGLDLLGIDGAVGASGEVDADVLEGGQSLETAGLVPDLEVEGGDEHLAQFLGGILLVDDEQVGGIAEGEGFEEDGIDNAEDGGGGAGSEGQGEQGDHRKGGRFRQ